MLEKSTTNSILFGGGCFWCTEAIFKMLKGVKSVMPGYSGGTKENPTYEEVCSGKTGYAEVVKIEYDQGEIKFADLLTVFFATHDPTTLNRQGADVGPQYRSVIFYSTEAQKKESEEFIKKINKSDSEGAPVVTQVAPLKNFYTAEDYHKDFYNKNKNYPYCKVIINPKLEKVQKNFSNLLDKSENK